MDNNTTTQWSDMATKMVNTWAETGTQMWKSWFELMGSMPTVPPIAETQTAVQDFAQRFLDNRAVMIRFLELSVSAWQDILPKIETGDDWQTILSKYTEKLRHQLNEFPASATQISENTAQLWQLYLQETQKIAQLWTEPLGLSMGPLSKMMMGDSGAVIELNNLYWNVYERTLGNLIQTPSLGQTREYNAKLLAGFDAWAQLYKATSDYQVVLANIQVRSFEELMKELVSLAEKGETVKNWRHFQQVWSNVADRVFAEAFQSEENLKLRGNFLNAINAYRLHQQELMELSMKMMNLPTRSEVDEIHKTIYELRKEVKSLKKRLASYEHPTPPSTPPLS